MEEDIVRFVVVGEAGSGKSSLVCAMGQRPPPTAKVVEELRQRRVKTQDGTKLHVVDTDAKGGYEEALQAADVVLLVHRADEAGALEAAVATWLPRAQGKKVLLVGTGIDRRLRVVPEHPTADEMELLLDQMADPQMEDRVVALFAKHKELVGSLEVSCTLKANVEMVLSLAYSAARHPREPLVDKDQLSRPFKATLRRMFFLLDSDGDGRLNEAELIAYRRTVMADTKNAEEAVAASVAKFKAWKEWAFGGVSYSGWERIFDEMVFDRSSLWSVWVALRYFGYNDKLEFVYPPFRIKKTVEADERLCLSKAAISFIIELHGKVRVLSGGVPLNNIRAILAMLPKSLVDATPHWANYDDLASGEVVAVAGNGISLPGFVCLFQLLLERNTLESAVCAHRIAFILGYRDEAPFVEIRNKADDRDYFRVLVFGSGRQSRSRVIKSAIIGATRNVEDLLGEDRRVVSAGKFDSTYLSAFAPSRLPDDLQRIDVMLVPFDTGDDLKTFQRACSAALKCRELCPVLFCCAQKPDAKHIEWCRARGVDRILDATDASQVRAEIRTCLSDSSQQRLVPTAEDLRAEEERRRAEAKRLAERNRPARQKKVFVGLVLVAVLLVLALAPSVAEATRLPGTVVTMAASALGAYAVIRAAQD